MKVVFLVNSINGPSTRYRVLQYLPYLEEKRWDTQVYIIPKDLRGKIQLFFSLKNFDMVFVQKRLLSFLSRHLLRKTSKCLTFDFDDSIMFRDSPKGKFNSLIRKKRFGGMVKNADTIIAGNDYLKKQAVNHNENVFIVPTPINMRRYKPKIYQKNNATIILGWIGSSSTVFYLQRMKKVWDDLFIKFPNIRLKIVADRFFECDRIPVIKKKWNYEEEIDDLHSFDIGLMPLTDDPWSRGKCGFKLLQCMAVGVPVVCSPVGVNKEMVEHGENGFWATGASEWLEYLSTLINDFDLRQKMARKAIQIVEGKYALHIWAPRFLEILGS